MATMVQARAGMRHATGALAGWFAGLALVLFAMRQSLRLPSAYGIEDWLGWTRPESVAAVVESWCREGFTFQWDLAAAYLLVDQAWFVPIYVALIVAAAFRLRATMSAGTTGLGRATRWLLVPGVPALAAGLAAVDTLENLGGMLRLGAPWMAFVLAAAAAAPALLAVGFWRLAGRQPAALRWLAACALLSVMLAAAALAVAWSANAGGACGRGANPLAPFGWAHGAKLALAALIAACGLAGSLVWWFGGEFDEMAQSRLRSDRASTRALCSGIVGRSRYVLAVLAVFALLILGLDQCRDVLLTLVDARDPGLAMVQRLAVLLLGAVACGLFAHGCWAWARLAGMVERAGLVLPPHSGLLDLAGRFARAWARALTMAPLALSCVLAAYTMGDLVHAAGHGPRPNPANLRALPWSAGLLVAFALLSLATGSILLRIRHRLHLAAPSSYYNSEPDVHALIWYRTASQAGRGAGTAPMPRWAERLAMLTRPAWLPVIALLLAALLRGWMSWAPETTAVAPPTLVLLILSLTWWLGVAGLLTLWEQRHAVPWVLVPLAWVGLLTALGLSDNHALAEPAWAPHGSGQAVDALLGALRGQQALVVLALVAGALAAWTAAVAPPSAWLRRLPVGSRWAAGIAAFGVAYATLVVVDRWNPGVELPPAAARAAAPAAPQPLEDVLRQRLQAIGDTPGPLFLVAAEGGGIRSAFWTAQVLAQLHEHEPGFDRRLLLLSGVSGGSFGHAVYRACLRSVPRGSLDQAAHGQAVRACIEAGFERLDPLSPLLGGLLFDDVLARGLPLGKGASAWRCERPGCGQVTRALAFEREWMRAFPPMAEPLAPAAPGEPMLALNSTWVETGNRTVAASALLHESAFPAAAQLAHCVAGDLSLATAAHTSARFPFTNALAGMPDRRQAGAAAPACRGDGHLIDGGYFDNSGVSTLLDVQRALEPLLRPGQTVEVILVRNGRRSRACEQAPDGPPRECIVREARRTDPAELEQLTPRSRLGLYADLAGPAVALVNVSGIGAHGRHAPGALRAALGEVGLPCAASRVRLVDQVDDGALVPLGWYLSPSARAALRQQAATAVVAGCAAPMP